MAGRLFSPGTPISSTNKIYRHDKTEILLKVALNTITRLTHPYSFEHVNTLIACQRKLVTYRNLF
jgi:hypothetical protein